MVAVVAISQALEHLIPRYNLQTQDLTSLANYSQELKRIAGSLDAYIEALKLDQFAAIEQEWEGRQVLLGPELQAGDPEGLQEGWATRMDASPAQACQGSSGERGDGP